MLSRFPRCHNCVRRAYSTTIEHPETSPVAAISSKWPRPYRADEHDDGSNAVRSYESKLNPRYDTPIKAKGMDHVLYVKLPEEVGGLPQAYAILRAIERKYGPCRDHNFRRSITSSRPDDYRPFVHVSIADSATYERLRLEGEETLEVDLPKYDRDTPGGAGLENVLPVLLHQSRDDPSLYTDHKMTVTVSVATGRSDSQRMFHKDDGVPDARRQRHSRQLAMGFNFVRWDGFYTGPRGPRMSDALDKSRKVMGETRYNQIAKSVVAPPLEKPEQDVEVAAEPQPIPEPEPEPVEMQQRTPSLADVMAARAQARADATAISSSSSSSSSVASSTVAPDAVKPEAVPKKRRVLKRQLKLAKQAATEPEEKVQQAEEVQPKQESLMSKLFGKWL